MPRTDDHHAAEAEQEGKVSDVRCSVEKGQRRRVAGLSPDSIDKIGECLELEIVTPQKARKPKGR